MDIFDRLWKRTISGDVEHSDTTCRLSELSNENLLILFGEPGIGKSLALKSEHHRLTEGNQTSTFIDLSQVTSSEDIFDPLLKQAAEFSGKASSNSLFYVHFDAFDEVSLDKNIISGWIAKGIKEIGPLIGGMQGVRLRITSRPVAWDEMHTETLKTALKLKQEKNVEYVLEPLTKQDVKSAIGEEEYNRVAENLKDLLRRPIFLTLFKKTSEQSTSNLSVADIYERFFRNRIYKKAQSMEEQELHFHILGRLSLLSLVANKPLISLKATPLSLKPNQFHWSEVVGAKISIKEKSWTVTPEQAWRALEAAPLIKTSGEWQHKSYPEFMAGYSLSNLPNGLELADRYLGATTGAIDEWKPADTTIEILKWASCYSEAIREKLIAAVPDKLVMHDLAMWGDESKLHLIDSIIVSLTAEKINDWSLVDISTVSQLKHSQIINQLQTAMNAVDNGIMARRFCIHLVEDLELTELIDDLWHITNDDNNPSYLRKEALKALNKLAPEKYVKQLKGLLKRLDNQDDNNDELRGHILRIMWPSYLTFVELLDYLKPVSNRNFIGAYSQFLYTLSIKKLTVEEAMSAITWISSKKDYDSHYFKEARASICAAIIPSLHDSQVQDAFVINMDTLNEIGYYLRHEDKQPFEDASQKLTWEIRKELIKKIRSSEDVKYKWYWRSFSLFNFIKQTDFDNIKRDFLSPDVGDEEMIFDILFNYISGRNFDEIPEVWSLLEEIDQNTLSKRKDRLEERLSKYYSQEIESSKHEIDNWKREQNLIAAQREFPSQTLQEIVAKKERFISEKLPQEWWQLDYVLTLKERVNENDGSRAHYENDREADLSDCQAWKELSEGTKRKYTNLMLGYVNSEPLAKDWNSENNAIFRPAAAGVRALIYICNHQPHLIDDVTKSAWQHWTPATFQVRLTNEDQNFHARKLFAHLFATVPDACLEELRKWKITGVPMGMTTDLLSFFSSDLPSISREFLGVIWEASHSEALNISDARQLIQFLAEQKYSPLIERALNSIASIDDETEATSEVDNEFPTIEETIVGEALKFNLEKSWLLLRQKFSINEKAVEQYLLSMADRNAWGGVSITKHLTEKDLYFLFRIRLSADYTRESGYVSAYDELMDICFAAGTELKSRGTKSSVQLLEQLNLDFPTKNTVNSYLEEARRTYSDGQLNVIDLEQFKKVLGSISTKTPHADLIKAQSTPSQLNGQEFQDASVPIEPSVPPQKPKINKTISILLVASEWSSSKGGLSTLNRQLAIALAEKGHEVSCLIPTIKNTENSGCVTLIDAGDPSPGTEYIHELDNLYHWQPKSIRKYDLIIGHDLVTGRHAYQIQKKINGSKLAIIYHTIPEEIELYKHDALKHGSQAGDKKSKLQQSLIRVACLNIAVGPRIWGNVFEHDDTAIYITPPLNADYLTLNCKTLNLKIPTKFYFVGRMEDSSLKGWEILLKACLVGQKQGSIGNFNMLLRGLDDLSFAELGKSKHALPVDINLKSYTTEQSDLLDDFKVSDCLIMPSLAEGYGLVAVDAISAKRAFLISNRSGVYQEILSLVKGTKLEAELSKYTLCISNNDNELQGEFIGKMKQICDTKEDAQSFASEIHKLASAQWTSDNMVKEIQDWINKSY